MFARAFLSCDYVHLLRSTVHLISSREYRGLSYSVSLLRLAVIRGKPFQFPMQSNTRRSRPGIEEDAFKTFCFTSLNPDLPLDHRLAAVDEIVIQIRCHSAETILAIWTVIGDLTEESATLEARKKGFALLRASVSLPDMTPQENRRFFQMITTPAHPSIACHQISALEDLTKHGTVLLPFETELIDFLSSSLESLFRASQEARRVQSEKKASTAALNSQRSKTPVSGLDIQFDDSMRLSGENVTQAKAGEEKGLIGAFYLITNILSHHPTAFDNVQLKALIARIAVIARQTTSRKTLNGAVRILKAATTHIRLPLREIAPCIRILLNIYKTPRISFEADLEWCLSNLLQPEIQIAAKENLVSIMLTNDRHSGFTGPFTENQTLLQSLIACIFSDPPKSEASCGTAIKAFNDLFGEVRLNAANKAMFEKHVAELCKRLDNDQDLPSSTSNALADLAAVCGPDISNQTFNTILDLIESRSGISSSDPSSAARVTDGMADCLIRLFLRCTPESAMKTSRVYKLLLQAAAPAKTTKVRLNIMKLLARLRCDSEQAVEVVLIPDTQGLAGSLCRTEATAASQASIPSQTNRESTQDQQPLTRQGRSSVVDITRAVRSRSATRSSNLRDQFSQPEKPLWMYNDWTRGLPEDPRKGPSQVVYSSPPTDDNATTLDLAPWLDIMIDVLKDGQDWEIYSYILVHLPSQLSNRSLFSRHVGQLQTLHNVITEQLEKSSFTKPPQSTKMVGGDVALCLYHILTMLLAYHEHLGRRELDNLVRAFSLGINKWDRAGKCCIHALALCCHEIPSIIDRHIYVINQKLSMKITQSDLAVDILEFLASLARLPEACSNATAKLPDTRSSTTGDDGSFFKTIFGTCIGYIRSTREQRSSSDGETAVQPTMLSSRRSGNSGEVSDMADSRKEFPDYVYALAYQVIIFWFLAIDVGQRAQHVGWIAKELAWRDPSGNEVLEEQSQVILDMMHRTAFSDLGETEPLERSHDLDEKPIQQIWLLGMSIVTVEVLPTSNIGQITKRQASGTTHAYYRHNTAHLPEHHIERPKRNNGFNIADQNDVFPNHMLLQLTSTIAPVPIPLQPIKLPNDESLQRALRSFDRVDTVDGHKAGVLYIGEEQFSEAEILANTCGTDAYDGFLSGLGTKVKLQGATFNTQGLNRESNEDGTHTYAWRDRVTEIIFHVTTMMPTDTVDDPKGDRKKRHIGNDRVKVIFNNSGKAFDFETFQSEMNEVNIVITPEAHTRDASRIGVKRRANNSPSDEQRQLSAADVFGYYKVETLTSSDLPQLSPAASPKVVSADALPGFVRQLALNASVFSQVWSELLGQGEYVSNWRTRLKEIKKLREKYGNTHASANVSYPMPSDADAPTYVEGDEWTGRLAFGGMAEPNQLLRSVDFTRWS